MDEQTHSTNQTISGEETNQEVSTNLNAEQNASEEGGSTSGAQVTEQVDNFSQMYDMLTERDAKIKTLTDEVASLKKTNTELLLKVNASKSGGDSVKSPYERFVDAMIKR